MTTYCHSWLARAPRAPQAGQGIDEQTDNAPFLAVCGRRFHHRGVPLVPIVHVKQWPLNPRMVRYTEPMQRAQQEIRRLI